MFNPKTDRLKKLASLFHDRIQELEAFFCIPTAVFIDYANVLPWQEKLGWHFDTKRIKQLLDSFPTIGDVRFYCGTLVGNDKSENQILDLKTSGYSVVTKPVKIMKRSIDISSISIDSPDILKQFIHKQLLDKLKIETIRGLNLELKELNKQGIYSLEDKKCNFDVEIGRDMLINEEKYGCFILWSGDSDFADSVSQLLDKGKKVCVFSTVRRVSTELSALRTKGLIIFDVQKIRDFICWPRELQTKGC